MGCIPTKTLVGSAKAIQIAQRGEEFGFRSPSPEVDWTRIRARKDAIVASILLRKEQFLEKNPRIDLVRGTARFLGPNRLSIDGREIETDKVIVASGVAPFVPDIPGLTEVGFETNETVMDLEELPGSMVIIGGGPEGMEFCQLFHRFGVKVTVLQRQDRILPREDEEMSRALLEILQEEGIDIRTSASTMQVERLPGGKLALEVEIAGRSERFECDRILVAAGRRPHNLAYMELEAAGIEGDPQRGIHIGEALQTSAPNAWAVGDVIGRMQMTHFAVYAAGIAVANALKGEAMAFDTTRVPGTVFTDPEVASVGLTEKEASAQGRSVKVGKQLMRKVGRARAIGETVGFVKIVVDEDTEKLLGMQILSHAAGELLPQGILMLQTEDRSIAPLTDSIYVHPTLSEGVKAAATNLKPLEAVSTSTGNLED
ncbi:MAG: FAD-dependent oxidoreductase [Chloroflexi bacterium]|nr:FAD-dependent oxidoreductase [Chloroflexota bacterium]